MNKNLSISAQRLGYSFEGDPELKLPTHPRYISEVMAVPYGANSVIFEGVRDTQVISGRSARTFIPQLLQFLDGSRDLAALQQCFPRLPSTAIRDAIALLYSRGLLEDGPLQEVAPALQPLSSHLGRYNDVTRANSSRYQALDRLARTRVAVAAGAAADILVQALQDQGLARVQIVHSAAQLNAGSFDLLLAVFSTNQSSAASLLRAAHARGIRALHAHVGEDQVEIGPLIIPGVSACYDCLRQLHDAPQGEQAADVDFWAGVMALHAINFISRVGVVKLYNSVRVHRRTDVGSIYEKKQLARLPGCPHCGMQEATLSATHPDTRTWILHHAPHVMTCKELRSPRDHQIHYAASNLILTSQEPQPHYGALSVALAQPAPLSAAPIWSDAQPQPQPLDQTRLHQLLHYSAGYQVLGEQQQRRRIAPSGGGLGSARLYVVVRQVAGLDPGAYHYFGYRDVLERVGHVDDLVLASALGIAPSELPPVVIIASTDMRKVQQKYDEFAFRLGNLDAGVARQYLQEVADANGLRCVEYPDQRDAVLGHLLQLPLAGNRNMLTFSLGVRDAVTPAARPSMQMHHYHSVDTMIELCARLGPTRLAPSAPAVPAVPTHPLNSLDELMRVRRSQRSFAQRPLAADWVSALARLAWDAHLRREASGAVPLSIKLWVAVMHDSAELPAGIYAWQPEQDALVAVRTSCTKDEIISTTQQHGYAEAAVSYFIGGDFEKALQQHGPRGYRELINRAGGMMARTQLAALSCGAVGSLWGGIAEEGVGALIGGNRYQDCPLFAASYGYPEHG